MVNSDWNISFKEAYCTRFQCSHETFQDHLLWSSFSWVFPLKIFGRCVNVFDRNYFNEDRDAIQRIGETYNDKAFLHELNNFHYIINVRGSVLRRLFHLRISLRKIISMKQSLFKKSIGISPS
jgi:hypothetical protein